MTKYKRLTLLILLPCTLILSGCLQSDKDLVIAFLLDWAKQKGILDDQGNPTPKAVGYTLAGGYISTGDPAVDAALDAGAAIDGVKKADKKLKEANDELKKDPPDVKKAAETVDNALKDRPEDWMLRNNQLVLRTELGEGNTVKDLGSSGAANNQCGGDQNCLIRLYQNRAQLVDDSIDRQNSQGVRPNCDSYNLGIQTHQQLIKLDPAQSSQYEAQMREYQSHSGRCAD